MGIRTTPALKRIGCAMLKTIIENDRLKINDFETLRHFDINLVFVQKENISISCSSLDTYIQ